MAFEKRNNRLYYYTKKRIGKRVVSQYIGRGPEAEAIIQKAKEQRQRRETEKRELATLAESLAALDQQVDNACHQVETLVSDFMIESGYHRHKGEWRKKREQPPTR